MLDELHLDFETRSEADLKKVGSHAYFEHPSTTILCAGYAFGDEEPEIWYPEDIFPPKRICEHVSNGGTISAWNAAFERLAWRHVFHPKMRFPAVKDAQWQCTMTEALSMNLPGSLKDAAPAVGLEIAKDDEGYRLMMKMCKPRAPRKGEDRDGIFWHGTSADIERLGRYCLQDVRVEREIGKRVLRMRPSERELYLLDMEINDRGVFIDKELCQAAHKIVNEVEDRLDKAMFHFTNGHVSGCNSTAQLLKWLKAHNVETDAVDREHIEDLLIRDLPANVEKALTLRQEGSKTSTAKIESMLRRQQKDGRMRGNLQFYGASATGRWAARGAQLQNLTRPQILGSKSMKPTPLEDQIKSAIEAIHNGSSMVIELIYGQPLTLIADCVRSMICAPKGKILRSSDFSNIEGRGVAWAAGQEDKLDAFRAYDNKTGPDLYLVAAAGIYNVDIKDAEPHRQIGKVAELALGYQGGPRAFAKMAKAYGVRIGQHYDGIWGMAAEEFKDQALSAWDERGRKTGMSREGWLASEVIKLAWRAKNWRIAAYWKEVEDAAIDAVKRNVITAAGKVKFRKVGSFLFCLLPSGRAICYPYPRLREVEAPWGDIRTQLMYKAVDQYTKKWQDKAYYGGLGVENITQAIARDVMAAAMVRVKNAGYNLVLTVHDEIITEDPIGFGSLDHFKELMAAPSAATEGFPISVSGWEGMRYRKS